MYYLLALKMYVNAQSNTSPRTYNDTRIVEMGDYNAVRAEVTVFSWSAGAPGTATVDVATTVSDDMENWKQVGSTQSIAGVSPSYTLLNAITGINARYVRLELSAADNGEGGSVFAIIGAGLNLAKL